MNDDLSRLTSILSLVSGLDPYYEFLSSLKNEI
jgi:hypothetical protein